MNFIFELKTNKEDNVKYAELNMLQRYEVLNQQVKWIIYKYIKYVINYFKEYI